MEDIPAPTLVVHGTENILIPPGNGERLAAAIPSRLTGNERPPDPADPGIVDRAAAGPVDLDQPHTGRRVHSHTRPRGIGKSTFHVWVIAHLTRGTLPGVHLGEPKPCIIAAAEDSWARTIVPRLIAAGADMALVYRVDVVTEDRRGGVYQPAPRRREPRGRDHRIGRRPSVR